MINKFTPETKFDSRGKAISSFIFGIISGASTVLPIVIVELLTYLKSLPMVLPGLELIFYWIAPSTAIIGLIFGILGLKSTKKKFAIAGIILCLIGLIVPLYYFLR